MMNPVSATPQPLTSGQLVRVDLGSRAYEIVVSTGEWEIFPAYASRWLNAHPHWQTETPQALLVTDSQVNTLFADRLQNSFEQAGWKLQRQVVPAGEASKSQAQVTAIYDRLVEMRADRKTVVMALGGGVMGDLAGFAAASYARGLPFLQIPTTLLAAVDSSVGGSV